MHLKKSALLLLAFLAANALNQSALAQTAPSFTDTENTWAADCIQNLAANKVINGYGDRTFRPNAQVSRAEFAAMLQKAFPGTPQRSIPAFQDMQERHWAMNAVRAAAGQGFLSGYPDGTFRPEAPIQRVDVVVALMGGLPRSTARGAEEVLSKSLHDWGYVPEYARMPLSAAIVHQFLVSYPNPSVLRPTAPASRADVAALICQAQSSDKTQPSLIPEKYLTQMLSTPAPLPGGIQLDRVFYNLPPQRYPQDMANMILNSLGSFAVSEDGSEVALSGSGWGEATPRWMLLNAKTGSLQLSQDLPEKGDFPIFLRNNHVVVGTAKGVEVWDRATQKRKHFFDTPPSNSKGMVLSPDGNYLAVHSGNTLSVWQWQSGRRVKNIIFNGTENGALTVVMATNKEGQPLVAVPNDQGDVQIWHGITGQLLQTIPSKFKDGIGEIGISPDGRWLAVGSPNQGAQLWDISTNTQVRTFNTNSYPQVMTFSPDGRYLAVGYEAKYHGTAGEGLRTIDSLQLWEIPGGRKIGAWQGHEDVVRSISFSSNGRTLYSGSGEGIVKAWNIPNPLIENPTP